MNREIYKWGIGVLKILLCFCVILIHYGQGSEITKHFNAFMSSAVPCFMIITFYFNGKMLLDGNRKKLRIRIVKLVKPCIGWASIYFIIYKLMYNLKLRDYDLKWKDLLWQLITGHSYNAPLWYMYDLIVLTIVFGIILCMCQNKYNIMLVFLLIVSIVYLYSGLNGIFNELIGQLKWTLGRFAEMLPYSIMGLLVGLNNDKLEKIKYPYKLGGLGILLIFWIICNRLETSGKLWVEFNYGYAGLGLLIKSLLIFGVCLFVSDIPISRKGEKIIIEISQYTLGIYCMHVLVGECLMIFLNVQKKSIDKFGIGVAIFVLSYMFSWGISKLPIRGIKGIVS